MFATDVVFKKKQYFAGLCTSALHSIYQIDNKIDGIIGHRHAFCGYWFMKRYSTTTFYTILLSNINLKCIPSSIVIKKYLNLKLDVDAIKNK